MPKAAASRELAVPREDVWRFLAEPLHLADWWPGVSGLQPDRRGLAPGARWQLRANPQQGAVPGAFLRRSELAGTLVVLEVKPPRRLRFLFADDRIEAELELEATTEDRTRVTLVMEGPWPRVGRSTPAKALRQLQTVCQTAVEL